jgi:hypothetical protein
VDRVTQALRSGEYHTHSAFVYSLFSDSSIVCLSETLETAKKIAVVADHAFAGVRGVADVAALNEHALAVADVRDTLLKILCEGAAGGEGNKHKTGAESKKRMAGFIARASRRPSGGNPFHESSRKEFWGTMKRD